jgi:hypothetical protein
LECSVIGPASLACDQQGVKLRPLFARHVVGEDAGERDEIVEAKAATEAKILYRQVRAFEGFAMVIACSTCADQRRTTVTTYRSDGAI